MARYVPIGKPVNASEADGIRQLRDGLPSHFTVVGNFELSVAGRRNTLEFDAIVIGEYGVWVVEIKGWDGRIEGDIRRWRLEWGSVENPFIRTEYKAKALRHVLVQQLGSLPHDFFCEAVVFLPRKCEIYIDDPRLNRLLRGPNVWEYFDETARIMKFGPGSMSNGVQRQKILEAITPLASEREPEIVVSGFDIEVELERNGSAYREFLGRHQFLNSRTRARIKMFEMDPLLKVHQRKRAYLRMVRDMEAMTSLQENPYVARSYGISQDRNDSLVYFLASEWVGSKTLEDVIDHGEPLNVNLAIQHLLDSLDYMHRHGIIHRSLHPGVIYLTGNERLPVKVADFDFARVARLPSISTDLSELKTQGYCAPELWKDLRDDYDHRVDIYAIGVIIAELLLGRRLYPTIQDMLQHEEIWAEVRLELEPKYRDVLDHFLISDPDQRITDLPSVMSVFDTD